MTINKQEIYTHYLSKLEDALKVDNFDNIDYILEYIYTAWIPENILSEIDDILQEVTLYSELKEQEYKIEALDLINRFNL